MAVIWNWYLTHIHPMYKVKISNMQTLLFRTNIFYSLLLIFLCSSIRFVNTKWEREKENILFHFILFFFFRLVFLLFLPLLFNSSNYNIIAQLHWIMFKYISQSTIFWHFFPFHSHWILSKLQTSENHLFFNFFQSDTHSFIRWFFDPLFQSFSLFHSFRKSDHNTVKAEKKIIANSFTTLDEKKREGYNEL